MKKRFIFYVVFLIASSLFCNAQSPYEFENQEYYFVAYYDDLMIPPTNPFKFSFYDGLFSMDIPELDNWSEDKMVKETIQGRYAIANENGFLYIHAAGKKFLVLHSETVMCVLIDCQNNDAFFGVNKDSEYVYIERAANRRVRPFVGITGRGGWERGEGWRGVRVSSFLTETIGGRIIEYDGTLEKYYFELRKPWVEGAEGNGIGEWIEMRPSGNVCRIVFFNGYIDPNRPDLYYANSRIKEVHVTSASGRDSWTFRIQDTPNPQILPLPDGFNDILRFTIRDVYEGGRYSDTCLAGIYFLSIRGQ